MRVTTAAEKCSGCRACEIACSLHHTGAFSRANSSIKVQRFIDTGKKQLHILEATAGASPACDDCTGEATPLCVKYCTTGALTVEEEQR